MGFIGVRVYFEKTNRVSTQNLKISKIARIITNALNLTPKHTPLRGSVKTKSAANVLTLKFNFVVVLALLCINQLKYLI